MNLLRASWPVAVPAGAVGLIALPGAAELLLCVVLLLLVAAGAWLFARDARLQAAERDAANQEDFDPDVCYWSDGFCGVGSCAQCDTTDLRPAP